MVSQPDPAPTGDVGAHPAAPSAAWAAPSPLGPAMTLPAALIEPLLRAWLAEDLGRGDLTAPALAGRRGRGAWFAKGDGVFCGGVLVEPLFRLLDPAVAVRLLVADGETVLAGQRLLHLEGQAAALVAGERTALNLAMRLSGIATATAALVAELAGTGVRLADTRKTTPGLRLLEKYAVRCGGGVNHRLGLDDAAMLKENHLAWSGGIGPAIAAVRASAPWPARVIVEAETEAEAKAAVLAGADAVLLDEFSPEALEALVPRLRALAAERMVAGGTGSLVLEASGVRPEQLRAYGATGIDLISTSAPITRSAWLDLSMRFEPVLI
jgi:nicotinate-nucleotide pyrophosphorylase (carboxylating)